MGSQTGDTRSLTCHRKMPPTKQETLLRRRLVSFGSRLNEIGGTRSLYARLALAQLLSRGHAVFSRRAYVEHVADRDLAACGCGD